MAVPYNFLQELSGVGIALSPSEFDNSIRFIGNAQQQNYFFANEQKNYSVSFKNTLNKFPRDISFNSLSFDNSLVNNFSDKKNYSTSFNSFNRLNPSETGSYLLSFSSETVSQTTETGIVSLGIGFSFIEPFQVKDTGDFNIYFSDINFSGVTLETGSCQVILESFIKGVNKIYNSIDIVILTGKYTSYLVEKDYSNLDFFIYTGSYQGA